MSDVRELAETLALLMRRFNRRMNALDVEDPAIELPVAQLRLCAILQDGPGTMTELSSEMGISLSAVTQLADRLVCSGMVERVAGPCDRRVKLLQLTQRGHEVMLARRKRRVDRIERVMQRLTEAERRQAVEILQTLLDTANSEYGSEIDKQ